MAFSVLIELLNMRVRGRREMLLKE
jgi:hypothetical protein